MKKRRNNIQVMTIAILLVAVVGLSIGFAVFSNILTISSGATGTAACDDISVTVKADTITATTTQSVSGKSLAKKASHKIEVTIAYKENGDRADGDFTVEFGDITLTYESVESGLQEIAFTVDGITYQALEGMTWYDWSISDYSPRKRPLNICEEDYGSGFNYIAWYSSASCILNDGNRLTNEDVIVANKAYTLEV